MKELICETTGRVFLVPDCSKRLVRNKGKVSTHTGVSKTERFHRLWKELHERDSLDGIEEWYAKWCLRLPCGECKRHWKEITECSPPDFRSTEDFHMWTIRMHNCVNHLLGKPYYSAVSLSSQYIK